MVQRAPSGILVTKMSWGRDLPSRTPNFHWLHSLFVPFFTYLHFSVYLSIYSLLLCPNSFLCPQFMNLKPSYTNTQKISWLWYNNCCHCFCLHFLTLHLASVSCIQTAHSLGSNAMQYEAGWSNMGFNPHWFWPYYKHIFPSTWPIQLRRN